MLNNNNSPIAGVNSFKNNFQAPAGSFILETTLQPGDWIGGGIGSSTGYVRAHFWDADDIILGDGTPYNIDNNSTFDFRKKTSTGDTSVDRSFAVYSCDANGNPSGDILSVSLTDLKYTNVDLSPLTNLENLDLGYVAQTLLNLTEKVSLKRLSINSANLLESIDITGLTSLKSVTINGAPLMTSLDLAGLTGLERLLLKAMPLDGSIDFTTLPSLEEIGIANCLALNSINVAGISNLIKIDLENIPEIASIDLTGLTGLQSLNIRNMNMANLDLTGLTSLNYLYFNSMSYFDTGDINDILGYLDANGVSNGYFYDGQISRSTLSNASFNSLIGKGWTLQIPTTPIEVPGAILTMPTTLQPNDSIDGRFGSSTGYIKIQYWDGTSQILGNGTSFTSDNYSMFNLSKTVSSDDSYLNKTIIAYSCDSHGYPSGNILSVDLNNAKYGAIDLSSLEKLQYLRLVDNNNIASLNLTACSDLYYFNVTSLSSLISVDLSGLTNLVSIISENNSSLSAIGLTGSSILARSQSEIDLGRATEYSRLYIMDNTSLNSIDLTGFENLESFNITNAPIGSLNRKLTYIRFFSIRLTTFSSVDLSNCLNIESALIVDNRSLISIDLTNSCSGEGTTRTNINDNPLLESISLAGCGLKNYGIYDNAKIDPYDIDSILAAWDSKGKTNGSFYGGNLPRTTFSNTNYTNLINKGWSLLLPATPILPAGTSLTIPTTLQPGQTLENIGVGTSTGYLKATYWDGTSQIFGNGTAFGGAYYVDGYFGTGLFSFSKTVSSNDTYENRSIVISSCTSTGFPSGDISFLEMTTIPSKVNTGAINLSGLTKLKQLFFNDSSKTNSLDFRAMVDLKHLYISRGNTINISGINLFSLKIELNDYITSFTTTSNMTHLTLHENSLLTSIDVSTSTNMILIDLYNCPITTITGMNLLTNLTWLKAISIPITGIDLTALAKLNRLEIGRCYNITSASSFDLTGLPLLTNLWLDYCRIPSFDLPALRNLTTLQLSNSTTILNIFPLAGFTNKLSNVRFFSNSNYTYSDIDIILSVLQSSVSNGYFFTDVQRSTLSISAYQAVLAKSWTMEMPATIFQATEGFFQMSVSWESGQYFTLPAWTIKSSTGYFKVYIHSSGAASAALNISGSGDGSILPHSNSYTWQVPNGTDQWSGRYVKIYTCDSSGVKTGFIESIYMDCSKVNSGAGTAYSPAIDFAGLKRVTSVTLNNSWNIKNISFNSSYLTTVEIDTTYLDANRNIVNSSLESVVFSKMPKMNAVTIIGARLMTTFAVTEDAKLLGTMMIRKCPALTSVNVIGAPKLRFPIVSQCYAFSATAMDSLLTQLDTYNTQTGTRQCNGDSIRTAASDAVYNSLLSKGWTFTPPILYTR